MKILVAGNLLNWGYNFVKLLRKNEVDAHLLMPKFPKSKDDPKTFENLEEYPEWIRFWNNHSILWKKEVVKVMREYDVIHAITELPIFAMFSRRPYVAFPTGSDINELVFEKNLKGYLLKLSYKKARAVVCAGPQLIESMKRLNLKNSILMASPWELPKLNSNPNIQKRTKCVFLYPSLQDWKVKANDRFLNAYKKLCSERDDINLLMIKHGINAEQSIKILDDENCKGKFEILPEKIPHSNFLNLYSKADVVVDGFNKDSLGLIGLEAMALGKPVLAYIKKELHIDFYGNLTPIVSCRTEEEILYELRRLVSQPKVREEIGKKSKEWMKKYYEPQVQIKKYEYLYKSILENVPMNTIKDQIKYIK